jgi:hypothetical protein
MHLRAWLDRADVHFSNRGGYGRNIVSGLGNGNCNRGRESKHVGAVKRLVNLAIVTSPLKRAKSQNKAFGAFACLIRL